MHWQLTNRRAICRLLAALVLALGLAGAAGVYIAAEQAELAALDDPQGYSSALLLSPEHSKKFLRDLEVYGGKANVLMFKFRAWLEGMFQGKSLAYLMAGLSLLVAAGLFYAGGRGGGQTGQPDPRPD